MKMLLPRIDSLINHLRVKYFTIKTPQAAKRLVDSFITTPNDSIVLPFIDHPGPISQEILSRNFSSLTVCERDNETFGLFDSHVKEWHRNKVIKVYHEDIFDLSFRDHCEKSHHRCSEIIMRSLNNHSDSLNLKNCDRKVKFLVPLLRSKNEVGFLTNIYYQMCLRIGMCSKILVHYYFLMSDRQFKHIIAEPGKNLSQYRSSSVVCNTIFNVHQLESFNLDCFQIELNQIQSTAKSKASSYPKVHLVHLEPKEDLLDSLDSTTWITYRFFVNQMMIKRTRLVLNFLEQWFGKFNEDLIHIGITEETRAGDLSAEQYLKLFTLLQDKPEYKKSLFLQAAASVELRL